MNKKAAENRKFKFGSEEELRSFLAQAGGGARIKGDAPRPAVPEQPQQGLTLETGKTKIIRQGDKIPNMTEKRFELLYILPRYQVSLTSQMQPFIRHIFEAHKIKLANGAWYKPDWWVTDAAGEVHIFEIKGKDYIWERTTNSIKHAADRYPYYNWYLCVENDMGEWLVEKVKS